MVMIFVVVKQSTKRLEKLEIRRIETILTNIAKISKNTQKSPENLTGLAVTLDFTERPVPNA